MRIRTQLTRRVVWEQLESRSSGGCCGGLWQTQPVAERTQGLVIEQLVGLGLDELPLIQPGHPFQPSTGLFENLPGHLGIGTTQFTGSGAMMGLARFGGILSLGEFSMHPNQSTGCDEPGDLARAELVGQRPDVSVNGFVVQARIHLKPTDGCDIDAGIQGSSKASNHTALAVTDHAHRLLRSRGRLLRTEPIHGSQHLLHFITLHGAPHFVGGPPQHLTLRLLELARPGQSAVGIGAIN